MADLVLDDFSGSGSLQSRNTRGNAAYKWVRCQPDRLDMTDLTISGGLVRASPVETDLSDGYKLAHSATGAPVILTAPYTVDLVFNQTSGVAGMAGVDIGASGVGFNGFSGSVFQVRNGATRFGVGAAYSEVAVSGSLSPSAALVDAPNTLRMSVGTDGFVVYKLNNTLYGAFDYYYPGTNREIAVMVWGGGTLGSIHVYTGVEPPIPGGDPRYFWRSVKNCAQEPIT